MKFKCVLDTGNKPNWDKAMIMEFESEVTTLYAAETYVKKLEDTQNEELCDSQESVEVLVQDELGIVHHLEVFGEYEKKYRAVGVWH